MKKWQLKLGGVLLSLMLAGGCVETVLLTAGAGMAIGAYKWVEGTMEKDYPKPYPQTWKAVLAACRHFNLRVTGQVDTGAKGNLEAVDRAGTSVKIQVIARPNQITTVKVRFGMMGNQEASAMFHAQVMRELGIGPTP